MKIIMNNMVKNAADRATARDTTVEAGKFDALLREAAGDKKTSGTASLQNLSSLSGISSIDTAMFLNLDTSRIVGDAERLVGTLEEFQTKLADTNIPLEELSPLIEKMDREKDLLMPSLEILPQDDPLRGMLNNVLIACSVEAEKFKRGDYL